MYIQLTLEEKNYILNAINVWRIAATQYMEQINSRDWSSDEDSGHNPYTPSKCYLLQKAQIKDVDSWTTLFIKYWENNNGIITHDFLNTKIWPFSVHEDLSSPILLGIEQKRREAYNAFQQQAVLKREGLFGTSSEITEQDSEKTIRYQ